MTKIEALRLELKCREMVEGTELDWWRVLRLNNNGAVRVFSDPPRFEWHTNRETELALGIIEGKPVWEGDELYCKQTGITIRPTTSDHLGHGLTWNPQKPKTVMVEMTIEDAEILVTQFKNSQVSNVWDRTSAACRKALEVMK